MAYTLQHHVPLNSGYGFHPPVPTDVTVTGDAEFDLAGASGLHAWLNDGSEQDVDPATLRIGAGDVPYCGVARGFEARLSRAAAYQLLALADYDERSGRGALRLGNREYTLARS